MGKKLKAICDIRIDWGKYLDIKKSLEIPGECVEEYEDGFICCWENDLGYNDFILNWKSDRLTLNYAGMCYVLSLTGDNVRVTMKAYSTEGYLEYMDQWGKSALHDFLREVQS